MTQAYALVEVGLVDAAPEITRIRKEALARYVATGYPTSKHEDWRFTPITPITQTKWKQEVAKPAQPVTPTMTEPFLINRAAWTTLVFVNGRYDAGLSHRPATPAGVTVEILAEALSSDPLLLAGSDATPFATLNSAVLILK